MPPEYISEGILSIKYDVYSFGVTILETISSMCRSEPARHHASIPWVSKILHVHTNTSVFFNNLLHFCWNYTRKCITCDFKILHFSSGPSSSGPVFVTTLTKEPSFEGKVFSFFFHIMIQ
jgi:hypothetical protein